MLASEILKQGQLFGEAAVLGALLMLLYDGIRIVRRIWKHGVVAVAAEDLLFWLFCALAMFAFMYRENDGVMRGFLIFGAAAGMIAYGLCISRHVVRAGTAGLCRVLWILGRVLRLLRRVLRVIFAPVRRVFRVIFTPVRRFFQVKNRGMPEIFVKICKKFRK